MADELKKTWKVFVRRNLLTKNTDTKKDKDKAKAKDEEKKVSYYGVVDTPKETITNEVISARIIAERPGYKKEVVDSVLSMRDGIVAAAIENGERVQDGVVHIAPVSRGLWPSKDHVSDPSKQKADISVTPVAAVRARLNAIHLSVCGEKDDGAFIGCLYALPKGVKTNTLKPGDEVLVTGEKMRVAPEDEEGLGVVLTDSQNVDWTLDHYLIENKAKRLVFRVPELPPETYTLKVITRFSNSNKTFLKAPRVLVYDEPLSVLPPVPPVPPNKKAAVKKASVKKAAVKKAVTKKATGKK